MMSIDSNKTFDEDTDSETDNFIELKTLPFRKRPSLRTVGVGGMSNLQQSKKADRKPGLKQRIFGARKPSKGSPKFDVVRSVEILNYTQKGDRAKDTIDGSRELRKGSFVPVGPCIVHGHRFEAHHKPTWCDVCEDFIWGLYTQAMRCLHCRYTCHAKCVKYVHLDCPKAPTCEKTRDVLMKETLEILSETDGATDERKMNNNLPNFVSSISQLRRLIEEYNDKSSLIMTLHDDCTFDGFIRVHMNMNRPVNVSSDVSNLTLKKVLRTKSGRPKRPLLDSRRPVTELFSSDTIGSSSDFVFEDSGMSSQSSSTLSSVDSEALSSIVSKKPKRTARRLSFYMPKETYKPLHVTSTTTVKEVIEALLTKYNVTDNPKKYAFYEKTAVGGKNEVVFRRLPDDEQPLALCLHWGASNSTKSFSLKENEDGTVQWMNFELPELSNFLKILQLEEDESLAQIYNKFELYRDALKRAIEFKAVEVAYTSEA